MNESDDEQTNFDIDLNASDANLLKLKHELKQLSSKKTQWDLAYVTVVTQEMTLQGWKRYVSTFTLSQLQFVMLIDETDFICFSFRYCDFVCKNHLKLLDNSIRILDSTRLYRYIADRAVYFFFIFSLHDLSLCSLSSRFFFMFSIDRWSIEYSILFKKDNAKWKTSRDMDRRTLFVLRLEHCACRPLWSLSM